MRKAFLSILLIAAILSGITGCKADQSDASVPQNGDVNDYIGGVDYSSTVSALVYEQIPGEEDGFYGIEYHEVTDIQGLLGNQTMPVCMYFYYSLSSDTDGMTAGVEDLAQTMDGQVLFIAVDGATEDDLSSAYEVEAFPEFVLIVPGRMHVNFGSKNYDSMSIDDVTGWLANYGYTPDYSKLQ